MSLAAPSLDLEEEAKAADALAESLAKVDAPRELILQAREQALDLRAKAGDNLVLRNRQALGEEVAFHCECSRCTTRAQELALNLIPLRHRIPVLAEDGNAEIVLCDFHAG